MKFSHGHLLLVITSGLVLHSCSPQLYMQKNGTSSASFAGDLLPSSRWSDPNSWPSGQIPVAGDTIMIPNGTNILLDVNTPELKQIHISGSLVVDPTVDIQITAETIHIMDGGLLRIGSEANPYTKNAKITLTGSSGLHRTRPDPLNPSQLLDNGLDNDGHVRGLHVENKGSLILFGAVPGFTRTKLREHAAANSTQLLIEDDVMWKAGTQIAVSITDFHGIGTTEIHTLAQNSTNRSLILSSPLATSRWGRLQYPRNTTTAEAQVLGSLPPSSTLSETPGAFDAASENTPRVLDQRALIVNLTRNILIEGKNDIQWTQSGFGCHVMVMGRESVAKVSGVEFRRCGQRRAMGRYPFHWHMLSYDPTTGQSLGDVNGEDHFIKNSAIVGSENRAVTVHGTNGVTVENNFAVDIKGHAFFLEDGVEMRNTIARNVAMKVRDPGADRMKEFDGAAAGFWITNPYNRVIENVASEAIIGVWNSFARRIFGESFRVTNINPNQLPILEHRGNIAHSNLRFGIMTEDVVVDEQGRVGPLRYEPRNPQNPDQIVKAFFTANQIWKNREGGYRNRVWEPIYESWVAADNDNIDFTGQTMGGAVRDTLFIARSLNSSSPFTGVKKVGMSSYHFAINIVRPTILNYFAPTGVPYIQPDRQFVYDNGFFSGKDLYLNSVGHGMFRNYGWVLYNSHPGFIPRPSPIDGQPTTNSIDGRLFSGNFSITGAIPDYYGYWGPADSWLVPSLHDNQSIGHPFYVHGLASNEIFSMSSKLNNSGRIAVSRKYIGLGGTTHNEAELIAIRTQKLDRNNSSLPAVANAVYSIPDMVLGGVGEPINWIPGGRHISLQNRGAFLVDFPGRAVLGLNSGDKVATDIAGAFESDIDVIIAFPWQASPSQTQARFYGYNNNIPNPPFTQAASLENFRNDTTGTLMFIDEVADRIYLRVKGGFRSWLWEPNQLTYNCLGSGEISHPQPSTMPYPVADFPALFRSWINTWSLDPEKISDRCVGMDKQGTIEAVRI